MATRVCVNARFLTQPISGVQRYAHELLRAWDDLIARDHPALRGWQFEMLAPAAGELRPLPLRHIPLRRAGRLGGHLWEQLQLPRLARGRLLFCPGNTAPLGALRGSDPVVVTVHDLSYLYFPEAYSLPFRAVYRALIPRIFRRAAAVITVSESERRAILERYPAAAGKLIPIQNGGLAARFREGIADAGDCQAGDPPRLLYVGALNRRKNLQGILAAAALLAVERDLRLILVGGGGRGFDNNAFAVPPALASRVEFTGQIDSTERLIELYRQADCLLFPSFYEASPLPPLEAMACGCPVLAGDIPSLRERCGESALFCDPHSPQAIAAQLRRLLDDPALRESLRDAGRRHAERFTWERSALATLEVLARASGGEPG